jgi:hypothetical protein
MHWRPFVFAAVLLAAASTSLAQSREPIGRFVFDVRAASTGLPTDTGWTPVVPPGTEVPSRSLGLDAGAHVYLLKWRSAAIGAGATWLYAKGTTRPPEVSGTTPPPAPAIPDVTTRVSSLVPQVSLNFGHAMGWSYLSAGLGLTGVESRAVLASSSIEFIPRDSGWVKTLNFGGGARWFIRDHFGVGFDLRWHKLSLVQASATHPGAPQATLVTAGVGVSIK